MDERPPSDPPDYHVDWDGEGSTGSFFGCVAMVSGLVFIATGGLCAFLGLTTRSFIPGLIGLALIGLGWMMINR